MPDVTRPAGTLRTTDSARVETFSDGVFAIALTLLVLDLIVEHAPGAYVSELLEQWPRYLAYLAAFLTIASIWLSHHDAFSRLARVDPAVRLLNLGLLLGVALVPWPAALLSSALAEPHPVLADAQAGVVIYVAVSLIVSGGWVLLSTAAARSAHLLEAPGDVWWFRANVRASLVAAVIAVAGGALGWFEPVLGLVFFLLVPLAFFGLSFASARRRGPDEEPVAASAAPR